MNDVARIALAEYQSGVNDGTGHSGGQKYWSIFSKKAIAWCSSFVGWCLVEAGYKRGKTMPKTVTSSNSLYNFYSSHPELATIHKHDGKYIPQVGDIALTLHDSNSVPHSAIVVESDGKGTYYDVEGNCGNKVKKRKRTMSSGWSYFVTLTSSSKKDKNVLHGIDIASWQAGIVPSSTPADFVIVKATGGTTYENPYFRQWADDVLNSGKLLGIYHFANDVKWGSAADEARWFLDHVRDYKGKFVPVLDWEGDALKNPVSWAAEWLDIVARETGATPMFYGYASNVNSTDYSSISKYPLWMASYLNKYQGSGFVDNPDNSWGTGAWPAMTAYQYTSTGRISGYNGNLDLSVFYGTKEDWIKLQGGGNIVRINEIAAAIHRHMCECPKHGYTQGDNRWGSGASDCVVEIAGRQYSIPGGDYDCSSSVMMAWQIALQYTDYAGVLGWKATDKNGNYKSWYTGNERAGFVESGLFEWKPMSFLADTGDMYLNEKKHVAMCQTQHPDVLSEFLSNEFGGITGGNVGDQTGGESVVRAYYVPSFGWNGILHYNGKADHIAEPNEHDVVMWPSNGGDNQRWKVVEHGDYFALVCKLDGRALDVKDGKDKRGADIILWPEKKDGDNKNQLWKAVPKDNGTVEIVSALNNKRCLDVRDASTKQGAKLCYWDRHGGANQEWVMLPNQDGTYTIVSNGDVKMVLDRVNGSIA